MRLLNNYFRSTMTHEGLNEYYPLRKWQLRLSYLYSYSRLRKPKHDTWPSSNSNFSFTFPTSECQTQITMYSFGTQEWKISHVTQTIIESYNSNYISYLHSHFRSNAITKSRCIALALMEWKISPVKVVWAVSNISSGFRVCGLLYIPILLTINGYIQSGHHTAWGLQ